MELLAEDSWCDKARDYSPRTARKVETRVIRSMARMLHSAVGFLLRRWRTNSSSG